MPPQIVDFYVELACQKGIPPTAEAMTASLSSTGGEPETASQPPSPGAPRSKLSNGCGDAERGDMEPLAAARPARFFGLAVAEASIAFHSIIIGIALGVTGASEFSALLIALSFHQFLEGFALGAAATQAGSDLKTGTLLALIYASTTPLGTTIGIAARSGIDQTSAGALITQGVLDAVSAGLLVFVAVGDHLNATKAQGPWLRGQKAAVHVLCFGALLAGAGAMAVIGKWA